MQIVVQYNTRSTQKSLVRHKNTLFDTKMPGSTQKMPYPACISCHWHHHPPPPHPTPTPAPHPPTPPTPTPPPTPTTPPPQPPPPTPPPHPPTPRLLKYYVFKNPYGTEKWNYIDIQIYLISLSRMKCNYYFLFVIIIMSADIDNCCWYGSI